MPRPSGGGGACEARGGVCVSGACLEQGGAAPLWINGASMLLADGVSISALEIDTRLCPAQRGGCAVQFVVAATGTCYAGEDPAAPYALPAGTRCAGDGVIPGGGAGRCAGGQCASASLASCGDGVRNGNEECDDTSTCCVQARHLGIHPLARAACRRPQASMHMLRAHGPEHASVACGHAH